MDFVVLAGASILLMLHSIYKYRQTRLKACAYAVAVWALFSGLCVYGWAVQPLSQTPF